MLRSFAASFARRQSRGPSPRRSRRPGPEPSFRAPQKIRTSYKGSQKPDVAFGEAVRAVLAVDRLRCIALVATEALGWQRTGHAFNKLACWHASLRQLPLVAPHGTSQQEWTLAERPILRGFRALSIPQCDKNHPRQKKKQRAQ